MPDAEGLPETEEKETLTCLMLGDCYNPDLPECDDEGWIDEDIIKNEWFFNEEGGYVDGKF